MVTRIAHLSTAHGRRELRVHLKECNSLARAGYEVHYIVADGKGPERVGDVQVHDIGVAGGRFQRMLLRPWRMLAAARSLQARLYHFHDPELLLIALALQRGGAKVVYDSHEDVPRSLMSRDWLPRWIRPGLSAVFEWFENAVARRISAVVGATPHIAARFRRIQPKVVTINNFPMRHEIEDAVQATGDGRSVCYLGGIGRIRGIEEMVRAMEHVNGRLILAGPFESEQTLRAASQLPGWSKVDYRGQVSRAVVREIMAESRAGLVFFHPEPNHVEAQPNKMFEYMSAGLPVLSSDFPLWRELLQDTGAGWVADPMDPQSIAAVINRLLDDPPAGVAMGQRGRESVLTRYQWAFEEQALFRLYEDLLA